MHFRLFFRNKPIFKSLSVLSISIVLFLQCYITHVKAIDKLFKFCTLIDSKYPHENFKLSLYDYQCWVYFEIFQKFAINVKLAYLMKYICRQVYH